MKSFSLKSRWIDARDEHYPSPQDKLKFDDKVEFPSGYSPPNFYNQLLIYSLEIFKQVSKFFFPFFLYFFFFRKENSRPFFLFLSSFFFFSSARRTISPRKSIVPSKLNLYRAIYTRSMFIPQSSKFSIAVFRGSTSRTGNTRSLRIFVKLYRLFINHGDRYIDMMCETWGERRRKKKESGYSMELKLSFVSSPLDAMRNAWKKNIANIWQMQEKFNTILTYY